MFEKVKNIFLIIVEFKDVIFKIIGSPLQTIKIIKLGCDINEKFDSNDDIKAGFESLELVLKFKRENPQEFDEIFNIAQKILDTYKQNPSEIKSRINNIIN